MNSGYIKLWRKSLDSPTWQNIKLWRFWEWCLLKASHKKHNQLVGFQSVTLLPGQFVFGRNIASKETGLSPQTVRTCKNHFEKSGKLTSKTTNKYSVITIVNWDTYQNNTNESTSKTTNNQPSSNQQVTTNKNDKECKEYIYCKFLLKDGSEYHVKEKYLSELKNHYPDVSLEDELNKLCAWCFSNPDKRKTSRGARRFIGSWMSRAQEKALANKVTYQKSYDNMTEEEMFPDVDR